MISPSDAASPLDQQCEPSTSGGSSDGKSGGHKMAPSHRLPLPEIGVQWPLWEVPVLNGSFLKVSSNWQACTMTTTM